MDYGSDMSVLSGSAGMIPGLPDLSTSMGGLPQGNFAQQPGVGGGLFGDLSGMGKLNLALGGLQTLGNLWGAWQSLKLQKKQFNFTKDFANANLANQIKSYNTALTDKITSRAFTQGMSSAEAQAYLNANKLPTKP